MSFIACSQCAGSGKRACRPSKSKMKVYSLQCEQNARLGLPAPPSLKLNLRKCKKCMGLGIVDSSCNSFEPCDVPFCVVVGAGISGMSIALSLMHRKIPCLVFEKDTAFDSRSQGYSLTMQQASSVIKKLGFQNLKDFGIAAIAHASLKPDGELLNEYGRSIHSTTRDNLGNGKNDQTQRFNIVLPRQKLRKMMFDKLAPNTVQWGHVFEKYECVGNRVRVYFRNILQNNKPVCIEGDLLIGADGIWSRVRRLKLGPQMPRFLGLIIILGRARCDHPLAKDKVFQTLGEDTRLYCMPFVEGTTMWQLSFPLPYDEARKLSDAGPQALLEEARKRCLTWHDPIPQLLNETNVEDVTGYPAYDRPAPEISSFSGRVGEKKDNVILIGDALHPMSPFKGQGANQGLIDGLALAVKLSSQPNAPIEKFEKEMCERVRPKIEKSAQAAVVLHSPLAIADRTNRMVT